VHGKVWRLTGQYESCQLCLEPERDFAYRISLLNLRWRAAPDYRPGYHQLGDQEDVDQLLASQYRLDRG
jgi:hypothetical protein